MAGRVDLEGRPIKPITICMIGAGGFIGSHLCEKLMTETPHKVLALDVYNDKIKHLLEPGTVEWTDYKSCSDLYFIDALPVVKYCSENNKRLIHFSSQGSSSPSAEGAENGLEFTIVRPFNWIGPRMDFIPGIDGPSEGVPRVLACFSNNLLRPEPLKLVDGGESQRTFIYIKDAIEAVLLMIENPERANGHIFNVGNPNNEVTVRQLAEMMTEVYAKVSGEGAIESPTIDVRSKEFYWEGYDDSDKRIPDMTIINRQLGWNPKTSLWDLLESTLTYQRKTYAEAVKKATSKPVAS